MVLFKRDENIKIVFRIAVDIQGYKVNIFKTLPIVIFEKMKGEFFENLKVLHLKLYFFDMR